MRRFVIGAVADVGGGARILLSVDTTPHELRDAVEVARERDERHRRIWPDTNVSHHVYKLTEVPAFVLAALDGFERSAPSERTPEEREAFDAYLASSEALVEPIWAAAQRAKDAGLLHTPPRAATVRPEVDR